MSLLPLWGTGIAPAAGLLRRRITSDGFVRTTSTGLVRVASIPSAQVIFNRVTSIGDRRVTSDGSHRVTVDGIQGPQYFQTENVTSDGGEPFEFYYETNPWQPSQQGGENVFAWAYVTISWSMAAQIVLTPKVDGSTATITLADGSLLQPIASTFQLEQGDGNLQRVSRVFPVPLARRQIRNGIEVARWWLRGERIQVAIESTGPLGVGELMLEGIELEFSPVRKAQYAPVDAGV
jgi:hypothetical protein